MQLLPPVIRPPAEATTKRHEPRPGSPQSYLSCLRWDYGFTCPFCLTHESDWEFSLSQTPHVVHWGTPSAPETSSDYRMTLFSCRLCNQERVIQNASGLGGERLLSPDEVGWAQHFRPKQDRLVPVAGDSDAAYTHARFRLDDAEKVAHRRNRREILHTSLAIAERGRELLDNLLDAVRGVPDPESSAPPPVQSIRLVMRMLVPANHQAAAYVAVPPDGATECSCDGVPELELPAWLEEQTTDFPG